MSVSYVALAAASGGVATSFLKDLIAACHLYPDMSYLACDPSKIARRKKLANLVRNWYDGRRDKHTRAIDKELGTK